MATERPSKYWLDQAVEQIVKKYPKGEIVLSSGISPSASYHIGHFREILTVEALAWALRQAGRKARHIHVVDNFDPLRKRYEFLPESFEQYVGHPVALIPDPVGDCHKTYADHFYSEFETYIHKMGIKPEVVKSYEDLYKAGKMADRFDEVLNHLPQIRKIFKEISNRELDENWTPIQVVDEDGKFFNADFDTWDKNAKTIGGQSYGDGHAKLNWRLDWPARWKVLGVMVEPHGRELASAGSAYQTGVEFAKEVFGIEAPLPVAQYDSIHLPGDPKKMSSSLGNLITPEEALAIMPPDVLRYFVVRSRPDKKLYFDSGEGLYNLIDEFSQAQDNHEHSFKEAYEFATAISGQRVISTVPFKHLVSVYQAALKDKQKVLEILERTGYQAQVKAEAQIINAELIYTEAWLKKYAPESVKFEVQKDLPKAKLSSEQKHFLAALAERLLGGDSAAQAIHEAIYELKDEFKLEPSQAFQAIYQVILGQDSGPKAGWFLSILDKKWLVKRLKLEA